LPSYLALHADESALSPALASGMGVHDQADILRAQSLLATLAPLTLATTTPSQVVAEALALRPKGVSVDHITYTSGSVILDGTAASREGVNAYKKALGADARFTSVSVPLSDLTGAQGGHFSLTLLGNF
jgi:Tfp pilus assembly protein PilN